MVLPYTINDLPVSVPIKSQLASIMVTIQLRLRPPYENQKSLFCRDWNSASDKPVPGYCTLFVRSFVIVGRGPAYSGPQRWDLL